MDIDPHLKPETVVLVSTNTNVTVPALILAVGPNEPFDSCVEVTYLLASGEVCTTRCFRKGSFLLKSCAVSP